MEVEYVLEDEELKYDDTTKVDIGRDATKLKNLKRKGIESRESDGNHCNGD